MQVWSLGREDLLQEGMATHFDILSWVIPWTEEPGRLWSVGLQRVRHDWSNLTSMLACRSPICYVINSVRSKGFTLYIIFIFSAAAHSWHIVGTQKCLLNEWIVLGSWGFSPAFWYLYKDDDFLLHLLLLWYSQNLFNWI